MTRQAPNKHAPLDEALGPWVIRHRAWIIIITLAVAILAASGLPRLSFNNDLRVFFSEDNPQLQALEALENVYTKTDSVFFLVAPQDGNVFTTETLSVIHELTQAAWSTPYSNRVDSLTNFQHTTAQADEFIVDDLVPDPGLLSETDGQRIRATALVEPLLVNRLVSPFGDVTGVNINIIVPEDAPEAVNEVAAFSRELLKTIDQKYPDVDVYLTGSLMFDVAFAEVSQRDMMILAPAMLLVLILVVGYALRSVTATLATLIVIVMSTITGLGLAGWIGIEINPASAAAPTIILTLAVADSVHILVSLCRLLCAGEPKQKAIAESLHMNLQPVFLTSITTIIGFLSMNFSDAPPFHDLGNVVAIGVGAAFFYSIFFLPAFMATLPVRIKLTAVVESGGPLARLADFGIKRQNAILVAALLAAGLVTAGVLRIQLNDDWMRYFDEGFPVRRATDFMEERLTGADYLDFSITAEGPDGINEPDYLHHLGAFAEWFRSQPGVRHVGSFDEIMKRLNRDMHGGDIQWYRIPDDRPLAAQYLLLYEMSLPYGLDLNNRINLDKSATRFTVLLNSLGTRDLRALEQHARAWLENNTPAHMHATGTGLSVIWADLSGRNIVNMLIASFGALLLISVILIFALRSARLGVISLIPNLAPALMAFGVWGLLVGQVGLGLSVVASMTLGIVVDDTVHFLSKFLHAYRHSGKSVTESVRYAFVTVGTAMWVTTAALVAGFLVLMFSSYQMSADMGLMSAITILLALVMDFLLLPVLIIKVMPRTPAR